MTKKLTEKDKLILSVFVIIIIMGICLLISMIFGLFQKETIIYKNECRNETYYIPEQCYYDENTLAKDLVACQEKPPKYIEIKKEICEQVVVNEIEYEVDCYAGKDCKEIPKDQPGICMGHYLKSISKKDLTVEWLNENCELIESREVVNKLASYNAPRTTVFPKKYKCGDYYVEVK